MRAIVHVNLGRLPTLLDCFRAFGVTRIVFPGREYRSESADQDLGARNSVYETARLMPLGDDGGFAEEFLKDSRRARDTQATHDLWG